MGNTPTLSLRVPPNHQGLVRDVVARLKADIGFADTLRTLLTQIAGVPASLAASLPDLRDLVRRLELVEAWQAQHGAAALQVADPIATASTAAPPPIAAPVPPLGDTTTTPPEETPAQQVEASVTVQAVVAPEQPPTPGPAVPEPSAVGASEPGQPELFATAPTGQPGAVGMSEASASAGAAVQSAPTPLDKPKRHREPMTPEKRAEILRCHAAGEKVSAIVTAMGIPQSTVSQTISRARTATPSPDSGGQTNG